MLQQGLHRLGMEADFLYMGERVPPEPTVLSPLRFPNMLPRLRGYDVIHAGAALAAFPFCFYRGHFQAVLVHDMHGHSSEMLMKLQLEGNKLKSTLHLLQSLLIEELTIHHSDYHIVVSRPLLNRLLAHHIPEEKILLLRNGVDTQMFKPDDFPYDDAFTVCYAGDFQVWQGVDLLIEAGRILRDTDIKLQFIGFRQISDHRRWKEKIRKALGHHAQLVDRVSQERLIGLLRTVDILVLPRPYHPATVVAMPTKFAEYIALGKPLIVTDVDETAQFVRKHDCGLVCRPQALSLARAIVQARSMGRQKLRTMGERGRRLAETTFDWNVICKQYLDFLKVIRASGNIETARS